MGWILLSAGVVVILALLFWTKIKALLPSSANASVIAAIDKAADVVGDAATSASLESLVVLCWVHGDLASIAKLAEVRATIAAWEAKEAPPTVTVTTTTGATVEIPTTPTA